MKNVHDAKISANKSALADAGKMSIFAEMKSKWDE